MELVTSSTQWCLWAETTLTLSCKWKTASTPLWIATVSSRWLSCKQTTASATCCQQSMVAFHPNTEEIVPNFWFRRCIKLKLWHLAFTTAAIFRWSTNVLLWTVHQCIAKNPPMFSRADLLLLGKVLRESMQVNQSSMSSCTATESFSSVKVHLCHEWLVTESSKGWLFDCSKYTLTVAMSRGEPAAAQTACQRHGCLQQTH